MTHSLIVLQIQEKSKKLYRSERAPNRLIYTVPDILKARQLLIAGTCIRVCCGAQCLERMLCIEVMLSAVG